jgi:HEAT repeat protein
MRAAATWVGVMVLWLAPAAFSDGSPEPAEDEPVLEGEAKQKHEKEVKEILGRLNSAKNRESVVGDIKILGAQKTRAARDALMAFATGNKNHDYVKHAFEALAKIGTKRGVAFLCGKDGLRSGNYLVQHSALEALGVMKHPASVGPLLDVLTDKASKIEIMGAAAKAVARTAPTDERVAETLFLLCDHKKDTIRSNALEALGYLGTDKAMARLVDAMKNDKNTRARASAATGIENSKRKDQIPRLREAVEAEKALTVKAAIFQAIKTLEESP